MVNVEKAGLLKKDGTDIFVHFTAIKIPNVRTLQEGQVVRFEEIQVTDHKPQTL